MLHGVGRQLRADEQRLIDDRAVAQDAPQEPAGLPDLISPAREHPAARAARSWHPRRMAFSARGASAASPEMRRETTGSEATGPDSAGSARGIATSDRQSPPSASVTARSVMIFPGSRTAGPVEYGTEGARPAPGL
jgi:hypothetical protein